MKKAPTIRMWLNGKPKRVYRNGDTVRCPNPKCNGGTLDKALYDSDICKLCGATLKPVKTYYTIQSGKAEIEILNDKQ